MKNDNHKETKWYETLTFKMALLGIMAIMFLIPLQLIKVVISERAENSRAVKQQISDEWGKAQTITGPVLNIPVSGIIYSEDGKSKTTENVWHIMPENIDISGKIIPQVRYKGIYESVIYESDLKLTGIFLIPEQYNNPDIEIRWEDAYYTLGISDNRGINRELVMYTNNTQTDAKPGVFDSDLFNSGVTFPAEIQVGEEKIDFEINLDLKGSSGLFFTPAGKFTHVIIESSWSAPSFTGNFLPESRSVSEEGFSASWYITHLNRNFPQSWFGSIHKPEKDSFGVNLLLEIDHYRKSERSAKYGLLFIAFTYLSLLFLELSSKVRIHLFHYFLVSLSLILFFSLLNSLSEHIGFSPAYLISSVATICLLSIFTGSLLKRPRYGLTIGGILILLYSFIYILLALNEIAYLAGNIGLFVALAAIMLLSSKTNLFIKTGI
ncbi:MAG TPA: cell envelope integrity protein CreD [Bacteroidales bacterium]|nr:cell envelope integrity protein CreD [Bacteroidales bacterium]